ncbi:TAXI family TRAP transporter solute-binding subunit [Streptomyces himalayensis]|uniref:TAXI family TRAP transporter solute-binding subunit n=1 Tax=Streptomyces himalayensis subsp. himalayensis TaxID=2756131 RepID=A0A7W0DU69_9ACTN|nr:TAXI family TRAP transporter solute-binding subunit [Streptomyces himalayensis]MBA2951297.1 TAXI family TRAP transporter solute-binding subunit [Streptomyces himalayensis subsp. himalayensis]
MFQPLPNFGRRRALLGAAAAFVSFGLLLWWLLPLDEDSPGGRVTFSTGVKSGVYERYGELLEQALARDLPKLSVTLRSSEGSQENLQRVATGEADFTVAAADAVKAYQQAGKPGAARLRGCARLYDDYVQLVVPRSSDVHSVKDLRNKRVAIGQTGSGVRLIANRVLEAAGLDADKDVEPRSIGINTMPKALESGKIDAFFWSGGLPTTAVKELSERFEIRFVELGDLVDELHRLGGVSRYYRASVMPADAYPEAQHGTAVSTLAVANLLVTTDRTDPQLTEGLTRTVIDSRDRIGREVHAAQLVDLRTALYTDPLELHEGARRYYRSVKP